MIPPSLPANPQWLEVSAACHGVVFLCLHSRRLLVICTLTLSNKQPLAFFPPPPLCSLEFHDLDIVFLRLIPSWLPICLLALTLQTLSSAEGIHLALALPLLLFRRMEIFIEMGGFPCGTSDLRPTNLISSREGLQ
jgi:hypothetical protein